jgi:hypothetical protein
MMAAREQKEENLKKVQHKKYQDRVFLREKSRLLKVKFYAFYSKSQGRCGGGNRVQSVLLFRLSDRQSKERVEVRAHLHFHLCCSTHSTLLNYGPVHASHAPTSNVHEFLHARVCDRKKRRSRFSGCSGWKLTNRSSYSR